MLQRHVHWYSRDRWKRIEQSNHENYRRENSADVGLEFPLYIDIHRSIQIL